jgi:hypothetical protein
MVWLFIKNKNTYTCVDDIDYEIVKDYTWFARRSNSGWYVVTDIRKDGIKSTIRLHRLITDCPTGSFVDHINGDSFDNRRCNLRIVTAKQNSMNSRPVKGRKYKGVAKASPNRWRATLRYQGKNYRKYGCKSEREAAIAYNELAIKLYGEYAYLNHV